MVTYRKAALSDNQRLQEIDRHFWPGHGADGFQLFGLAHGLRGIVAEINGEIVGYIIFRRRPSIGGLEIWAVAVLEEHQRRGIGTELVRLVYGKLDTPLGRDLGFIETIVSETNLEAHLFLRSVGFIGQCWTYMDEPTIRFYRERVFGSCKPHKSVLEGAMK